MQHWPRPVAVTGLGCMSPLGMDLGENLTSLRRGRDAAGPVTLFDVSGCHCQQAAELPDPEVTAASQISKRAGRWHRSSRMLLAATHEAWQQSGWGKTQPDRWIVGTTSGGMSFGEDFARALRQKQPARPYRRHILDYLLQEPLLHVADHFGWEVEPVVLSNACASGSNAVGHAARLVAHGLSERVVCGGYDALSQLVFAGFDCLRASTPGRCRPFDRSRDGLILGEGAAVLVLESADSARQRGARILGQICGYGAASDNHHLTQPEPGGAGPSAAMHHALTAAGWSASTVDYINAHGTGTPFNDSSEGRAIAGLCPQARVSSTKSMMGHSLGAAGAIEAVFTLLALQEGFFPPNLHFEQGDEDLALRLITTPETGEVRRALSNSFGFGGANATLALEAWQP